mgnify:FL=1
MDLTYLDNASTTAIDPEVLDAMLPFLKENYGNASSLHSFGKTAKVLLEDARDTIAEFIGAESREIFFTNNGTESNNFAIKGLAFNFIDSPNKHIISTSIEHSAVLDTLKFLSDKFRFNVTYVKPSVINGGIILPEDIISGINENTFLVAVMHSNNETGLINDIKSISDSIKEKNIFIHTDSVQSIGKTDFNVKDLNINSATLSAHKIYGPKGIAALYVKDGTPIEKFIHGGMQERNMRGGTENIASIAGFKKAVELIKENYSSDIRHYMELNEYLTSKIKNIYGEGVIFNSGIRESLPNIVNISFDNNKLDYDEEMVLIMLDLKGIAVSGGSACTAGTHKPSHVLTEIGRDQKTALGSVRISFSRYNTRDDIDKFINALGEIVKRKN